MRFIHLYNTIYLINTAVYYTHLYVNSK